MATDLWHRNSGVEGKNDFTIFQRDVAGGKTLQNFVAAFPCAALVI